jgi:ABC-2 type transport system ATP-binding protein
MSTISISHLRKTYGPFVAVDDLSLEIPTGTVYGLLGPNGAGKTSTFKCMLGLANCGAGQIAYDGQPLTPATFERIAYVPERSVLYDHLSVADHFEMTRRAFKKFDVKRANELVAQFGVDPRKCARALSKGMKTATMVAIAFAREPDFLILDEPTSGLDPVNQRSVLNLIINEATRGCTILFSSHQIGQVERAAERIAIMQNGRLALEGAVDDLKADRKIVEGILPTEEFSVNGYASDSRIARIDKQGRILRLTVIHDPDAVAAELGSANVQGVRVVDLNLEDIFIGAVAPNTSNAVVVEGAV